MGNDELDQKQMVHFAWRTANDNLPPGEDAPGHSGAAASSRCDDRTTGELRRALHSRHFAMRAQAIETLDQHKALTHDDLEFVIRDMMVHSLPLCEGKDQELEVAYRCAAMNWLTENCPSDLVALLEELYGTALNDDHVQDAAWALEALAAIRTDHALPLVDAWLGSSHSLRRDLAVWAVYQLPLELAEPRMRRAACDPSGAVRYHAVQCWEELTGEVLADDAWTGVNLELLRKPPSASFLDRLHRLRQSHELAALAAELIFEAPDREALCLLVVGVQDDEFIAEAGDTNLRQQRFAWADLFVQRFGEAGVEALCALARTGSPEDDFHWVDTLPEACCLDFLNSRSRPARHIQALVRELLNREPCPQWMELGLVEAIGVLEESEAQDWIWKLLSSGSLRRGEREVAALLTKMDRSEALDATIADRFEAALQARDYRFASAIVGAGIGRGIKRVIQAARKELDSETTEATRDLHVACVKSLAATARLDDAWFVFAMSDPLSLTCKVVSWGTHGPLPMAAVRVLEDHLASPDIARAVEAAWLLILRDPAQVLNLRIRELHDMAEPEQCLALTRSLLDAGYDPDELLARIEPLFDSDDMEIGDMLWSVIYFLLKHRPQCDEWLHRIASRTPLTHLSDGMITLLNPGVPQVEFWLDGRSRSN